MNDRLKRNLRNLINVDLSPLWDTMSRNWLIKLCCVLLAFAVWQGIRENISHEIVVTGIPLVIKTGKGRAVLEQSTDVVTIRFRGSRDDVRFITSEQVSVELDLTERTDSLRQKIKLTPRYVHAPSQAHPVHFIPAEVLITLDREVERVLPVKASFSGQLPDGMVLERSVCDPASVRVSGAEQRLLDLEQVRTMPIRLDGRYNSFGTHVPIAVADQPWTVFPNRVMVNVELIEQEASRTIEQSVVCILQVQGSQNVISVSPEKVDVVLQGSSESIEAVDPHEIFVFVDCTELLQPTDYELQVRVDAPRGVQVERVDPPTVQVSVKTM